MHITNYLKTAEKLFQRLFLQTLRIDGKEKSVMSFLLSEHNFKSTIFVANSDGVSKSLYTEIEIPLEG